MVEFSAKVGWLCSSPEWDDNPCIDTCSHNIWVIQQLEPILHSPLYSEGNVGPNVLAYPP